MTTTNTSAQDVRSIMCFTDTMVVGYLITSATIPSTNELMVDWLTPLLPRIDRGGLAWSLSCAGGVAVCGHG